MKKSSVRRWIFLLQYNHLLKLERYAQAKNLFKLNPRVRLLNAINLLGYFYLIIINQVDVNIYRYKFIDSKGDKVLPVNHYTLWIFYVVRE